MFNTLLQLQVVLHALLGGCGKKKTSKLKVVKDTRPFEERWNESCDLAFLTLKQKLISTPILAFPDYKLPFCLEIDASIHGFGAILSQKQNGKQVMIACVSRKLRVHEKTMKSYSSMKLEFLALHWTQGVSCFICFARSILNLKIEVIKVCKFSHVCCYVFGRQNSTPGIIVSFD